MWACAAIGVYCEMFLWREGHKRSYADAMFRFFVSFFFSRENPCVTWTTSWGFFPQIFCVFSCVFLRGRVPVRVQRSRNKKIPTHSHRGGGRRSVVSRVILDTVYYLTFGSPNAA